MESGNSKESANLVGKPIVGAGNMESGLTTNVGYATGGAGCHYDFGDTTGAFAAACLNNQTESEIKGESESESKYKTEDGNVEQKQEPVVDTDGVSKETVNK